MKSFPAPYSSQRKPFEAPPQNIDLGPEIDRYRERIRQELQSEAGDRKEIIRLLTRFDLDDPAAVLTSWVHEHEERARTLRDRVVTLLRSSRSNARMAQAALELAERNRPFDVLDAS